MAISQARSKRKASGARYKGARKKRQHELGSTPTLTRLGKRKTKRTRVLARAVKTRLLHEEFANVRVGKKIERLKITAVLENPANRHYVRRNILTKGTVVKTEKGNARITNRPGQEGCINAVLITTSK